jgi:hypothetical protein
MVTGGASCATNDQYLIQSAPTSTTSWGAMCQVFQTGVNVSPASISVSCVATP